MEFLKESYQTGGSVHHKHLGLSSRFHPCTKEETKCMNTMLEQYISCYVNYQQNNWDELLPFAEVAYSNVVYSSIRLSLLKWLQGSNI
ncbi:Tf2-1: Tf2-1 [Crotalus adamanteus]|uniref:Tf2-1: Tf2-1 n=1 Tax=Crotalus adamanteus TaxID=8729 RepID=A0AAW1B296_CROAD